MRLEGIVWIGRVEGGLKVGNLNYYLIEFIAMKEKRVSNKLKQKQLETKYLEEQTKKMEDKLGELKKQIEQQKKLRSEMGLDSTVTRWQKTVKPGTLKSYAKQVLQQQKQAYSQYGINQKNITGAKALQGVSTLKQIKQQRQQQQQKNPTKVTTFLKQAQVQQMSEQISKKTVLQNNFFKARMDVKKLIKQKSLQQFLQQNFIQQYLNTFREEGIDDLQTLRYINRQQLQQMGVKAGHQVKILKKIKEQFQNMHSNKSPTQLPLSTFQKIESGYGEGDVNAYHQQESKVEIEPKVEQNNVQLNEEDDLQQQQQDQVLITVPTHQISLQSEQQLKINCYECYRIIPWPQLHYDQKYFCSQSAEGRCAAKQRICPTCGKSFIKTEGYRQDGGWFCSLGCCPNHEQIEQLFFQWRRKMQ